MAIIEIAGKRVELGDEFLKLSPEDQNKTVDEIAHQIGASVPDAVAKRAAQYDPNDPRFSDMSAKKAIEGIPILGAYQPQASAAISAAAQPLTGVGSKGETWWDRYRQNLEQEKAASAAAEQEHPIASAIASGIGGSLALGGVGGAFPAAARAMGMTGRLLPAMRNAALSGAAIGAADTAARGGDLSTGATTGALTGAGGVAAGKLVGKGIDALRRMGGPPPPSPMRTIDVNGTRVPISEGVAGADPTMQAEEELIRRGNRGQGAQDVALAHDAARREAMSRATQGFSESLDPTAPPRAPAEMVTPQQAATVLSTELAEKELGRQAGEDAVRTQILTQQQELQRGLSPQNVTVADTPYSAAAGISQSVQQAARRAAQARTAAYERAGNFAGEFRPGSFDTTAKEIRQQIGGRGDPIYIDANTPNASKALQIIDEQLGAKRAAPTATEQLPEIARTILANGGPGAERVQAALAREGLLTQPTGGPLRPADVEQVRKQLVMLRRRANEAARAPGGSFEDARAVGRVMDAFDRNVEQAVRGGFAGDAQGYLDAIAQARQLHSDYRQRFSVQNPQDEAGKAMEAMIGKYPGTAADPDKAAAHLFGSQSEPGGQGPNRVAARILQIFGPDSPEWTAYRQGLLAHTIETPPGAEPFTNDKVASRIERLMLGGKGQALSRTAFTEAERNAALAHARNLRTLEQPKPAGSVDRILHNWSGRDGGPPATAADVVRYLSSTGGADKATTTALIRRLKTELSPASFNKIKQGMFTSLVQPPEGMTEWGERKIASNLADFLNGKGKFLAEELFTERERGLMDNIRKAYELMAPVPGTTNPSGSAHMGARILAGARGTLLPLLGFSHGGIPGAAAVIAADKAASAIGGKVNAARAVRRFYGEQPKAAPSTAPQALGAILLPALVNRGSARQ